MEGGREMRGVGGMMQKTAVGLLLQRRKDHRCPQTALICFYWQDFYWENLDDL